MLIWSVWSKKIKIESFVGFIRFLYLLVGVKPLLEVREIASAIEGSSIGNIGIILKIGCTLRRIRFWLISLKGGIWGIFVWRIIIVICLVIWTICITLLCLWRKVIINLVLQLIVRWTLACVNINIVIDIYWRTKSLKAIQSHLHFLNWLGNTNALGKFGRGLWFKLYCINDFWGLRIIWGWRLSQDLRCLRRKYFEFIIIGCDSWTINCLCWPI